MWYDSLNNQLVNSCWMENSFFFCACPTWSLITWIKGQWSHLRQELGTSTVTAIFQLVLKGHISPPVWNYLRKTSSVSHAAVSLAGWMFVKEWLLVRCDGFTFQIWTGSLVALPPPVRAFICSCTLLSPTVHAHFISSVSSNACSLILFVCTICASVSMRIQRVSWYVYVC